MNPLTAHLEKYTTKQPPLIQDEEAEDCAKRRSFSNCILFVLLTVFVFFLACFAVYTAIAMGIQVEKNQPLVTQPEALSGDGLLLGGKIDKKSPEEINKTESKSILPNESNSKLRVQILIKGNTDKESEEELSSERKAEQNKTEEPLFTSFPRSRIIIRKIIFHKDGLDKPTEVDSSEEVSVGSGEGVKDVIRMRPISASFHPNPLDILFNLLKLSEDPLENILNVLQSPRKESNFNRMEFPAMDEQPNTSDDKLEDVTTLDKPKTEPSKTAQSVQNEKVPASDKKQNEESPKQEKIPLSNDQAHFNELNGFVDVADQMHPNTQQKASYNENESPHIFQGPPIRFYNFGNPHNQQFSPIHPVISYDHPRSFSNMMRLPFSSVSVEDKGYSNGETAKLNQMSYSEPLATYPTKQTSVPPSNVYSSAPSETSTARNGQRKFSRGMTENTIKGTTNQIQPSTQREQPTMIRGINTENIKPFENFFNSFYHP